MLYLQSVPMTESIFAAALAALLWGTVEFRHFSTDASSQSQAAMAAFFAGLAACAASLTRYEGWFLIPFVAIYVFTIAQRKWHAVLLLAVASLGPLSWLAHNQFYYSNPLEFFNGEYSAKAIYARQLASGIAPYPGDHQWSAALNYYFAATKAVLGQPLLVLGAIGLIIFLSLSFNRFARPRTAIALEPSVTAGLPNKLWFPILLLALPPVFYIWSMHSGSTPIYVPTLWPHSWYNTRYALAALPLASFASAAGVAVIATRLPNRLGVTVSLLAPILVGLLWLLASADPISICWKESQINSEARRNWTAQAVDYLSAHRNPNSTILLAFGGDLPGILRAGGIPIHNTLHDGNHPIWDATVSRPELFVTQKWAIAREGDPVFSAILRAQRFGLHYEMVKQIIVEGAPAVDIFERQPLNTTSVP
jgi:hypothetical protein